MFLAFLTLLSFICRTEDAAKDTAKHRAFHLLVFSSHVKISYLPEILLYTRNFCVERKVTNSVYFFSLKPYDSPCWSRL